MKKTLLQMTQDILNDMDSDEVNSIDDTVESQQVASIIRQCYEEVISNRNWPHLQKAINLDSSVSLDRPTEFRVPEGLHELVLFNYDCHRPLDGDKVMYQEIKYIYPDQFLRHTSTRNSLNPNVVTITGHDGIKYLIYNDQPPAYWTSFDDDYITCDAYQVLIEDTLRSDKTQCLAYMDPVWVHMDNAVPDLPTEAFSMLLEESKSTAFFALKQMVNQKAEAKAVRQQRWLSRKAWRTHGGVRYDNYGRRSAK